ncbi:MAG: ABC-type uncharacterized transport system permease subunit [Arenicella sp.]|jgi:ABC-type uncharacterized transport system permease subunit
MPDSLFAIIAVIFYGLATVLVALFLRSVKDSNLDLEGGKVTASFVVASIGAAFHIAYALKISFIEASLNASLSSMMVLMSGMLVLLFLLGGLLMPIRRLGILVFPLTIMSLIFTFFWGNHITLLENRSLSFSSHIVISLLAYCLLAIASIQALLYSYQERQIKHRTNPAMLMALPPLQTMELLLFRLVGFGFAILTLTLVSGAIFSKEIFGYAFGFKHHTILALLGWLVFAILLFKRVKHGLRGSRAVIWTISGFLLIQLGYFGTKIVSEILSLQ